MALSRVFTTLLASLACFELSYFVSASPAAPLLDALKPRAAAPNPQGAVLSPSAQTLVNQTVSGLRSTGHQWDMLAAEALLTLVGFVESNGLPSKKCTLDNVYVRREWGALSKQERKNYINAVLCLQKLPSKLDPVKFPGARTRYDDFVGVHINQTLSIHITVG
jgi:hypothetical protein